MSDQKIPFTTRAEQEAAEFRQRLTTVSFLRDSSNKFVVVPWLGSVRVNQPVPDVMTCADALNLAAWLQVVADPDGHRIAGIVAQIKAPPASAK